MGSTGLIGGPFERSTAPAFLGSRTAVFDRLYEKQKTIMEARPDIPIKVTLPSGDVKEGLAFKTSPYDIAVGISKGLADSVVVAKVLYSKKLEDDVIIAADEDEESESNKSVVVDTNAGELWDMMRPLVGDCTLSLLKFDDPEAKTVFWHSSAHI